MTALLPGWGAALVVVAALASLLAGLAQAGRAWRLPPEVSRKLVHLAMGLTAAGFPWLFDDPLWVAACALGSVALLLAVRTLPRLQRGAQVLYAVKRASWGELCFALAVALLYWLSADRPAFYLASLLVLTLGDALAALVGKAYGRARYRTREAEKSWEGSIALFAVSYLAVLVPLLLLTGIGRAECLLIALIVALLAVLMEGASWHGLDNLVLPLGSFLLLEALAARPLEALLADAAVSLGLAGLAALLSGRTRLQADGLMAATLLGACYWVLGGLLWLVPPLVVFLVSALSSGSRRGETGNAGDIVAIALTTAPWLLAESLWLGSNAFFPFAVAFGAHLYLVLAGRTAAGAGLGCALAVWAALALPSLVLFDFTPQALRLAGVGLAIALGLASATSGLSRRRSPAMRLLVQGAIALAAALVALAGLELVSPGSLALVSPAEEF